MVYKIYGSFEQNFDKLLSKISKYFYSIYINGTLFVALSSIDQKDQVTEIFKQIFKPAKNFYIEKVDEKNIQLLPKDIKDWCLENLVRLDTEKFEKDQQENLRRVWDSMDKVEEELKEIQKKKQKGG